MLDTFYNFFINIFGEYEPCYLYDSNTQEFLDASINWGYVMSIIVFIVVLWLILKTIGGLIYEWLR